MKRIDTIQRVYFIGIGGIGMSALARYFLFNGKQVSGYDRTTTPLTRKLSEEGIAVHYEDDINQADQQADLVVYTPAIPDSHQEKQFFQRKGYLMMKRSEVLGLITEDRFNICVAGTHGKTTISTMIAHILRHSGYGCNAFLGGIAVNYDSNYWSDPRKLCVIEADEYDRSFLKLSPDIAVISAMDADHLDIYGSAKAVEEGFIEFSGRVKPGGLLISKYGLSRATALKPEKQLTYAVEQTEASVFASAIRMELGSYYFTVAAAGWKLENILLHMGGRHNVENMTAAIAVAMHLGVDAEKIKAAVTAFKGVKRRFEYIVKRKDLVFVDDYAHHPEELKALITGARALFHNLTCTVIFQPHLFSRTRDFADGFAESLDLADEVILLPVYPAREQPLEGVNSELILNKMKLQNKRVLSKAAVLDWVAAMTNHRNRQGHTLLITAGAGDIDTLVQPIGEMLEAAASLTKE